MKLFPILLLVLLLPRRKIAAFVAGAASFGLSSLGALWFLGPSVAVACAGSVRAVVGYQGVRVAEWMPHDLSMNHSLFVIVKVVAALAGHGPGELIGPYAVAGAVLFVGLFFGRLGRMPKANQLLAVTVFMVLLPPVSYFYTLVHLETPFAVLVLLALQVDRAGTRIRGLGVTLHLFVPVFASFTLFTFRGVGVYGGAVQALFLAGLLGCAVWFPFDQRPSGHPGAAGYSPF